MRDTIVLFVFQWLIWNSEAVLFAPRQVMTPTPTKRPTKRVRTPKPSKEPTQLLSTRPPTRGAYEPNPSYYP
jgi:hypothetical protein